MRAVWLTVGLCVLIAGAPGRGIAQTPPEDRVDQLFRRHSVAGSPGAAVAVIRDGAIVLEKGYGLANLELEVPITTRSVFYVGSVSKQFVATAIGLLALDGALSLDDDIRRYVPEIPDYGTTVTIRHLLSHTSGIRDYLSLMGLADISLDTYHDDQPVIDLIARQRALNFPPGSRYLYSNSGYFLLAVIVERVSGEPIKAFAERRIFGPLGMHDTHFHDDYTHLIPRRASAYFPADGGGYTAFLTTFDRVGSGGVYSTVEDLAKWDANFYDHRVGGDALHALQHTRGVLTSGDTIGYALGLEIGEYAGYRSVEHGGALGGYRANILRLPDQRLSVIILANVPSVDVGTLSRAIIDLYLPTQVAAAETVTTASERIVKVPEEALRRVTGHYWSGDDGLARAIVLRDGKLFYERGSGNETELAPIGRDRFLMVDVGLRVVVSFAPEHDRPERMEVDQEGAPVTRFTAYQPWSPEGDELAVYAGAYYTEDLDVTWRVSADTGGVTLTTKRGDSLRFLAMFRDTFQSPSGLVVEFSREGDRVTGFVLQAGRVRNLAFSRRGR